MICQACVYCRAPRWRDEEAAHCPGGHGLRHINSESQRSKRYSVVDMYCCGYIIHGVSLTALDWCVPGAGTTPIHCSICCTVGLTACVGVCMYAHRSIISSPAPVASVWERLPWGPRSENAVAREESFVRVSVCDGTSAGGVCCVKSLPMQGAAKIN
jgi:hypothetical protein